MCGDCKRHGITQHRRLADQRRKAHLNRRENGIHAEWMYLLYSS